MRPSFLPMLGIAILSSGCTVMRDLGRTTVAEPVHFATDVDHLRLHIQANKAAEEAWVEMCRTGANYSADFKRGFLDGFADYLQFGGNGEPPTLPPRDYWKADSVAGRLASQEWSAGFREGSSLAKRSGIRDLIVVSLTGPGISPKTPAPRDAEAEPRAPALPAPRILDGAPPPP